MNKRESIFLEPPEVIPLAPWVITMFWVSTALWIGLKERCRNWNSALNLSMFQKIPQHNLSFQKLLLLCRSLQFFELAPKKIVKFMVLVFIPFFSNFWYQILFCQDEKWSDQFINIAIIVTKWVYSPWSIFKVLFKTKESLIINLKRNLIEREISAILNFHFYFLFLPTISIHFSIVCSHIVLHLYVNNPKGNITFIFPFHLLLDLCENYTLKHSFPHSYIMRAVMPVCRKILTIHFSLIDPHLFLLLSRFPTISFLKSNSILPSKAIKGKQKPKKNAHLNLFIFEK